MTRINEKETKEKKNKYKENEHYVQDKLYEQPILHIH